MMNLIIKKSLLLILICLIQTSYAEELEKLFENTNIFTSPEQREQLDLQRLRLELSNLVDELPAKVEIIKKKKKALKLLPKIVYKGMIQRQGEKPIYWIEDENNLQGKSLFKGKIKVTEVNNSSIKIDYKDSKGINLKPSQTFVPVEKKIYEGYEFKEKLELEITEIRTKTIVSNDEDALTRQLGALGKLQKAQKLLK